MDFSLFYLPTYRAGFAASLHAFYGEMTQSVKLADMVGTTRSRVNAFMNKFKKLGFIEYNSGGLTIKDPLLTVILRDERHTNTHSEAS